MKAKAPTSFIEMPWVAIQVFKVEAVSASGNPQAIPMNNITSKLGFEIRSRKLGFTLFFIYIS